MKFIPILLAILLIAATVVYLKNRMGPGSLSRQRLTLEQKLELLAECGLELAVPFTFDDLLLSFDREEFEAPGFDVVLFGLAMVEEEEPCRNHCANLWHFDTECIEGSGSYTRIAERMVEMSQGALVLDNIKDYVDIEEEEAWLSFTFHGEPIKIAYTVDDDWVDAKVFDKFVELLGVADPSKVYIADTSGGGQDMLIGCVTKEQLERLNSYGLKFAPWT